ncbi:MAG: alkaline phosphatase D family protein [Actinomycetota bacterium]|nr:alkaline phosphatase D family protein [Actinomycetota bacterium]
MAGPDGGEAAAVRFPTGAFRDGVASGDPLADRVVIWTRVSGSDEAVEVRWTVASDPALREEVASGTARAEPSADHTVHVDVGALSPSTTYWYGFHAFGVRSPVGRTRTLPDAPRRLRVGVISCAKYSAGYFNAYARVADREDLDLVLHLGDYIYEYGPEERTPWAEMGRGVEPPRPCVTLADYRARYEQCRRDPDVQRLHARHPLIATLDDHEVCNDAWRDGAKSHDPETQGDWAARKAAGLRAWSEWLPLRIPDPGDEVRIHRSFSLGPLADLIVLDGRTHRDEQRRGPAREDPARTLLGEPQLEWFLEELERSRATWKVVANSVMIGQVSTSYMPEELGEPLSELGILSDSDVGPAPDQWDGYPAERDRIFRRIRERGITGVVFVSGDVHTAWAVELRRDSEGAEGPPLAVEFVTASVTSENLDEKSHLPPERAAHDVEREVRESNPHVRWVDLDRHGYFVLELTPEHARADWWFVDEIHRPTAGEELAASWVARAGEAGLGQAGEPAG